MPACSVSSENIRTSSKRRRQRPVEPLSRCQSRRPQDPCPVSFRQTLPAQPHQGAVRPRDRMEVCRPAGSDQDGAGRSRKGHARHSAPSSMQRSNAIASSTSSRRRAERGAPPQTQTPGPAARSSPSSFCRWCWSRYWVASSGSGSGPPTPLSRSTRPTLCPKTGYHRPDHRSPRHQPTPFPASPSPKCSAVSTT